MNALQAARIRLLMTHPFYGYIAMRLAFEEDESVGTMGTDGRVLRYAPSWVASLTPEEVKGVLAHEIMHIALLHHVRRGARDVARWNIACDYAVDPILVEQNLTLPEIAPGKRGHVEDRWTGKSAEQIYDALPRSVTHRTYGIVWDAPPDARDIGEWVRLLRAAARAAEGSGSVPAEVVELIHVHAAVGIDWRALLAQYIDTYGQGAQDHSWLRPSRRYLPHGVYLPSLTGGHAICTLVLAVDTSGSISTDLARQFLAEIQSILQAVQITRCVLIQADARVQQVTDIDPSDPLETIRIRGRGGTDFRPVFRYLDVHQITPTALIYLTDGRGSYPSNPPSYPVLWALTERYDVPWGDVVEIGGNQ